MAAGDSNPTLLVDVHQKPHDVFFMVKQRIEACRAKCQCKEVNQQYDTSPAYKQERPIRGRERTQQKRREIAAHSTQEDGYYIWFEDFMFNDGNGDWASTGSASDDKTIPPEGGRNNYGYLNTLYEAHKKGMTIRDISCGGWGAADGLGRFHESYGPNAGVSGWLGQLVGEDHSVTVQGETINNPASIGNWQTTACAPPRWRFDTQFNGECPATVPPYYYRTSAPYGVWTDDGSEKTGPNYLIWTNYCSFQDQASQQWANISVFNQESGELLHRIAKSGKPEDLLESMCGWNKDLLLEPKMPQMNSWRVDFDSIASDVWSGGYNDSTADPNDMNPGRFYCIHCGFGSDFFFSEGQRVCITAPFLCRPGLSGEEGTEDVGKIVGTVLGDLTLDVCKPSERNCAGFCPDSYNQGTITGMVEETYQYANAYGICNEDMPDWCPNRDSWQDHGPCPDNFTRLSDDGHIKYKFDIQTEWKSSGKPQPFRKDGDELNFDRWQADNMNLLPNSWKRRNDLKSSGWDCFSLVRYPTPYNVSCDPNYYKLLGSDPLSDKHQTYIVEYEWGGKLMGEVFGYYHTMSFAHQWRGSIIPLLKLSSPMGMLNAGEVYVSASSGDARGWCVKDTAGNRHPGIDSLGGLCDGSNGGKVQGQGFTPAGQLNFWGSSNPKTKVYEATGGRIYFKIYAIHSRRPTADVHYQSKEEFFEGSGPWNIEDWGTYETFGFSGQPEYGIVSYGPLRGRKEFANYSSSAPYLHVEDANQYPMVGTRCEPTPTSFRSRTYTSWAGEQTYDTHNPGPYLQFERPAHHGIAMGIHGYRSWRSTGNTRDDNCAAPELVHQAVYYEYDYINGQITNQTEMIQVDFQPDCDNLYDYSWSDLEAPHLPNWWPFKKAAIAGFHDRWQTNESNTVAYRCIGGSVGMDGKTFLNGPPKIYKWPVDPQLYQDEQWEAWIDACNPELLDGELPEGVEVIEVNNPTPAEDCPNPGWSEDARTPEPPKWSAYESRRFWGPPKN